MKSRSVPRCEWRIFLQWQVGTAHQVSASAGSDRRPLDYAWRYSFGTPISVIIFHDPSLCRFQIVT